jgi:glucose/arabinose dehydrogenase
VRRALVLGGAALGLAVVLALAVAGRGEAHPFHPGAETPDTTAPGLRLARLGSFSYPVYVTAPSDDTRRQFVVEQDGRIRVIRAGRLLGRPFIDLRSIVRFDEGERGLLSMAFAPDYSRTRRFYVFYTTNAGHLRVDELRRSRSNPNVAVHTGRRKVIEIPHGTFANHNGGQLQHRGTSLYIGTGDGGGGGDPLGSGQDLDSLLGKILRIDPRPSGSRPYTIPRGNPLVGRAGRDEIWHYGLRNPWRFSHDRANGNLSIGDVGQNAYEEVNFVANASRGLNFGWNCFEGFHSYPAGGCNAPGHRPPSIEYAHAGGASCSVTGGYLVRDPGVRRLEGRYLYGDTAPGRSTPPCSASAGERPRPRIATSASSCRA